MQAAHLIQTMEQRLSAAGVDNARRAAEELMAHILSCKPMEVYVREEPVHGPALDQLDELAARILTGEPLQYVIGHVDFMGLRIKCDPRALIPRPETELLVEEVLNSGVWEKDSAVIVDVGTGSGCIILALATNHPDARCTAVDASPAALELARENAAFYEMEDQIVWKNGHLIDGFTTESADAIVANLPYIATSDWEELAAGVRDHEPQAALDSGPSGLELIEELATQARSVLVPGGMLFLEFGYDQGQAVSQCLHEAGYQDIVIKQDLAGHDRIAIARNP